MKKKLAAITLLLCVIVSCKTQVREKKTDLGIFNLLPADTAAFVKVESYKKFFKNFEFVATKALRRERRDIKKVFGFDPLILDEVTRAGFDISKPFGFFVRDLKWQTGKDMPGIISVFLPCTDKQKVINLIKAPFNKEMPEKKWYVRDNLSYIEPEKNEHLTIEEKGSYLIVSIDLVYPTEQLIAKLKGSGSINSNLSFMNIAKRLDFSEDISGYADISKLINRSFVERYGDANKTLVDLSNQYNQVAINTDLDNSDLIINSTVNLKSNSEMLKIYDFKFDKSLLLNIAKNPVAIFSVGANFAEYEKFMKKTQDSFIISKYDSFLREIDRTLNIDISKDILKNMNGSLNFGIFDGATLNQMNINNFISVSVKDEAKMKSVLKKILANLEQKQGLKVRDEKVNGVNFNVIYVQFYRVYLGVHKNNFIISMNKDILNNAMSGDIDSGFSSNMKPVLSEKIRGDYHNLYFNFNEINKALNNIFPPSRRRGFMAMRLSAFEKIMSHFDYLVSNTKVNGSSVDFDIVLKTKFQKPFFQGFYEMLENISKSGRSNKR